MEDQVVNSSPESSSPAGLEQGEADPKPIKNGLPAWLIILVLVICLGTVYAVYSLGLKEPPPHIIKNKGA